ncbi:MAG: hypothetical protein ABI905_08280 [Betaproteobacteria bacterium]
MFSGKRIACSASAGLILAFNLSTAAAQGTVPSGTIVGAQSQEVLARPVSDAEKARSLERQKPVPAKPQAADALKSAVKSAQDLMQAKKYPEALAKLATTDSMPARTAEDTYLVERTRVGIASSTNDDVLMVKSLEAALATGQAPTAERIEFTDLLSRKYFNQKNFPQAIAWSAQYFNAGGKDPALRRAMVMSYYLNNDCPHARAEVDNDIRAAEKAGQVPAEEQLQVLASCAQKLDDKVGYAQAMEKYAAYYPAAGKRVN